MTRMEAYVTMRIFFCALIQEEVAVVELVDATDSGEHNDDTIADPEAGFASRMVLVDDSTSQANVSIRRYVVEGYAKKHIHAIAQRKSMKERKKGEILKNRIMRS